jgi:hypothetical protein
MLSDLAGNVFGANCHLNVSTGAFAPTSLQLRITTPGGL